MRILILPRYTARGASSRYRFRQYMPGLRRAGHEVEIKPLLADGYLTELYKKGHRGWHWLEAGNGARFLGGLGPGREGAAHCRQQVFPFLPAIQGVVVA